MALAGSPEADELDPDAQIELAIVLSGARLDLGEAEAAIAALSGPVVLAAKDMLAARVAQARAVALEAAGRSVEAAALLGGFTANELADAAGDVEVDDEIVVYDLESDGESGDDDDDSSVRADGVVGFVGARGGAMPSEAAAPAGVADGEGEA